MIRINGTMLRRAGAAVAITLSLSSCTEPAASTDYSVVGLIDRHVFVYSTMVGQSVVVHHDTTAASSVVVAQLHRASAGETSGTVFVTACEVCYYSPAPGTFIEAAAGDSVRMTVGSNPFFILTGVAQGDSIVGEIRSTFTTSAQNTYSGRFVARLVR